MYVNAKMVPVEITPGNQGGDKGEWLRRQIRV
jgi:hypothetical protein